MAMFDAGKNKQDRLELENARLCTIVDDNGSQIKTYLLWDREKFPDDGLVVTNGLDGCLFVFDQGSYEKFEESLETLPKDPHTARMIGRFFIADAIDTEFNDTNQIEIMSSLLNHAKIKNEAVIEGSGGFATIWSIDDWEKGHFPNGIHDIEKRIAEY